MIVFIYQTNRMSLTSWVIQSLLKKLYIILVIYFNKLLFNIFIIWNKLLIKFIISN